MSLASETFHRAIRALIAYDIDAYASLFAPTASISWPFAPPDWHQRADGPQGVRDVVGANLARSKESGRTLVAMHDLVMHELNARELVAEFMVEVRGKAGASARMPYVHVLSVDDTGRILALRDYFSGGTLRVARTGHVDDNAGVRAFRAFERATMAWDADMLAEAFAEDGSMAWPFAPSVQPIGGRENIRVRNRELMKAADAIGRRIVRYHDVKAHPDQNGTDAVIELKAERRYADGSLSSIAYVWVI
ncbi:MAG TPA: nuclear transport factor 2 family protein, partial [Myxococcota bacterium]